ncbi:MAG: CHAT domain-containing protein, partial [Planctomycetes bacterium]|nr:CHAT domain-containing protein [Planctomycetota bacterium]
TPAARSHALLARLLVHRIDRDGSLDKEQPVYFATQASMHARQAIELFERAHQRTPQLEPIWLLAELSRLGGETRQAHSHYQSLARLGAYTARNDYRIRALRGLVCLARETGDAEGVSTLLRDWASLQTPEESWELAREQALWLLGSDQAHAALTFLWTCKPTRSEQTLQWQALSCSALRRRGHLAAARRTLESMQAEHPGEWELLTLTEALQLLAEGHHALAEDRLQGEAPFESWSARGRVQALALLGEVQLAQGQASRALAPLRRALREAQSWESRRLGPGSVSGEWLGLHAVVLAAQAAAESGNALLAATLLEENQARHLGRALHNSLQTARPTAGPRQVLQAQRAEGAGILTFAFGAEFGISVHLGPNGQSRVQPIELSRSQLQRAVHRLRQAILEGDEFRAQNLAHELSTVLTSGIGSWAHDPASAPSKLRIVLHGPLAELPICILQHAGMPLEQAFELVSNPSLWGTRSRPTAAPDWSSLQWRFLGAPDSTRYDKLPAALNELNTLSGKLPGSSLHTGIEFTAEQVDAAFTSRDAVHLATHLISDAACEDAELRSHGLLLGQEQVYCASAVGEHSTHSPLIYLGACASGAGRRVDGEGLLGLARALQSNGARNLIVTLWPVSDRGSSAFAAAFHAAAAMGSAPSKATAEARAHLREQGHTMRDWAAFVHLGQD